MRRGVRDYIPKPLNAEIVQEKLVTISELISTRWEADEIRFARDALERDVTETLRVLETRVTRQDLLL